MRVVDGPGWNDETIASLYRERRLTIDQNLALPFNYIAYFFARMSVASSPKPPGAIVTLAMIAW
jgi:hypothetical protein